MVLGDSVRRVRAFVILMMVASLIAVDTGSAAADIVPYENNLALAPGVTVSQSSTQTTGGWGGTSRSADQAVDGVLNGTFLRTNGSQEGTYQVVSVAGTNSNPQAWWQADLGSSQNVHDVVVWNRTDELAGNLADFYLLTSTSPIPTALADALNDSNVYRQHFDGPVDVSHRFSINRNARYVKIQLVGTNNLYLAEVQIGDIGAELAPMPDQIWGVVGVADSPSGSAGNEVMAIEQIGNTIYVGGKFTEVVHNRVTQPHYDQSFLAAFRADTGEWIDWWRPQIDAPVYSLAASPDGSRLFVGGEFLNVNGQSQPGLVALDAATGETDGSWDVDVQNGNVNYPPVVRSLVPEGNWLYIGGSFGRINNNNIYTQLGRVNLTTGSPDTGWRPEVSGGGIWGLETDPSRHRVYLVGFFTDVNGDPNTMGVTAVHDQTAATIPGLQHPVDLYPDEHQHYEIIADGDTVWLAGTQHVVQMLNADDLSIERRWFTGWDNNYDFGGDFQAITLVEMGDGSRRIYASGHFWGVVREIPNSVTSTWQASRQPLVGEVKGILALDADTGEYIGSFTPDLYGSLGGWALHGSPDGCLWAGGDIHRRNVGDRYNNGIVRLCPEDGQGPPAGPPLEPPDTEEPVVSITGPGGTVGSTVDVTVEATDNEDPAGTLDVQVSLDGGSTWHIATWSAGAYHYSWNTTGISDGPRQLRARATDNNDNTGNAPPVTVTVDNTAPVVTIDAPVADSVVNGFVDVDVTVDDASEDLVVEVSTDGGATWQPTIWSDADSVFRFVWDTTAGPDGSVDIRARATDAADNSADATPVSVMIDNLSDEPTAAIVSPGEGMTVSGVTTIVVDADDFQDPAGTLDVEVSHDGGATWHDAAWNGSLSSYLYPWDTTTMYDGIAELVARATDSSAGVGQSPTVTVNVDNDNPEPGPGPEPGPEPGPAPGPEPGPEPSPEPGPNPDAPFLDVPVSHLFASDIAWLSDAGITRGCNPPANDLYCPDDAVTRGQMAAFLVRALNLTAVDTAIGFVDDDGSVFEADIVKLATAGITRGCNPPTNDRYCPTDDVTRGQMAAFLVRALNLTAVDTAIDFVDDDGSIFEADIVKLATAGITLGCNPPTNDQFCPEDPVTRGQMAAFLHRALGT